VRTCVLLIIALSLATPTLVRGQNLNPNVILNGGFESPGLPDDQDMMLLTNGSTYVSGWTILNDTVGQPPFYGNTDLNDAVLSGEYGLVLNQGSGVKTIFRTEIGAFYELGVWLRPDDCLSCDSPAPLRVTINESSLSFQQISGWSYQTVQFFATNSINTLELFNPSSPRDFKRYTIDDVAIRKVSGALLTAQLQPVITVEGTIGAKYQIQSANTLTSPIWTTITNLVLSNSPTFFMDTNSYAPGAPFQRIYRAVRVQ
jgi:hypothetical protein